MQRTKEPFDGWVWGGSTHWADCWQVHVTCALVRAVNLLDYCLQSLGASSEPGFEDEQEFVDFVRANK